MLSSGGSILPVETKTCGPAGPTFQGRAVKFCQRIPGVIVRGALPYLPLDSQTCECRLWEKQPAPSEHLLEDTTSSPTRCSQSSWS